MNAYDSLNGRKQSNGVFRYLDVKESVILLQ